MSSLDPLAATRRGTAGLVTAVGLAVLVTAMVVAQSRRAQLPDPVATHWGVDGTTSARAVRVRRCSPARR